MPRWICAKVAADGIPQRPGNPLELSMTFRMTFLSAEAVELGHRDALHANFGERLAPATRFRAL
jgi:hypothetical protein